MVQSAAKKTVLSECGECADPDECKAIADLGVDMLAAGIGNIHGKYPANWKGLSFETLAAVKAKDRRYAISSSRRYRYSC